MFHSNKLSYSEPYRTATERRQNGDRTTCVRYPYSLPLVIDNRLCLTRSDVSASLLVKPTTYGLPAVLFPIRGDLMEEEHLIKGEFVVDIVNPLRLGPPREAVVFLRLSKSMGLQP